MGPKPVGGMGPKPVGGMGPKPVGGMGPKPVGRCPLAMQSLAPLKAALRTGGE